jgi:hypothetical protein
MPPAGTVYIALDTVVEGETITLTLWPGLKYPGWNRSALARYPAEAVTLIRSFDSDELAPILKLFEKERARADYG